jgi:uncharacterized protein YdeI (YjbR/CyaY-like superfamily)
MAPKFFKDPASFRKWLEANHDKQTELLIGFYKKGSGKKSITYPEALDEALCFGWIDGVRRRIDDESYEQRFSPRRPQSIWSLVNVRHVERLKKAGRMTAPGLAAFQKREDKRTGVYAFENQPVEFSPEYEKQFRANKKAWEFFSKQPPYFVKVAKHYVRSAKKEETRQRRLQQIIDNSAQGVRSGVLEGKTKNK